MKYKLVLWDFDGTLADTLQLALAIYNRMADENQYRKIDDPHAVRDMGMREFLKSHGIPLHKIPFAFSTFLTKLHALATDVVLHDGIGPALQQISKRDILQGVVSSNSTENIERCLRSNNVETYFNYVSGTSRIFGKERRIRTAFRKLNIAAENVLYVGDEIRDIEASRAAGLDVAAVSWGLNSAEALSSHQPTHLIFHPDELLPILDG